MEEKKEKTDTSTTKPDSNGSISITLMPLRRSRIGFIVRTSNMQEPIVGIMKKRMDATIAATTQTRYSEFVMEVLQELNVRYCLNLTKPTIAKFYYGTMPKEEAENPICATNCGKQGERIIVRLI